MTVPLDQHLDDVVRLEVSDPGGMLRAIASGAAQVREAAQLCHEAGVGALTEHGRPRSVLVCGMGGSGFAGDLLAAVAGPSCPVPVVAHRSYGLPAWVGAADLVVAVSCSGATEETLSATEEAVRRGAQLLVVAAADSPLEALAARGRAVFVPVPQGRPPRASVWSLSTPLVVAADALGLLTAGPEVVEAAAVRLEEVAVSCRPDAESFVNPAKTLATQLTGFLPVVWGTSPLAAAAAYRLACQLNENAKLPAVWGVLPEALHNQVAALDGRYAQTAPQDLFRDRVEDPAPGPNRIRLLLLRDLPEHPQVERRVQLSTELAAGRGVEVSSLAAVGRSAFERAAFLVAMGDWTSAYLALLHDQDPSPVPAIDELTARLRG